MNIAENKKEPLVSISCITYNHVNFIRQCINGFLMQKTDFLIEVLIHDDASTDGTEEIIREYEAKYPEIIKPIYEVENQWVEGRKGSAVFNFPRVQGKYIAICEGDDYWIDPLKLQKQVDFLEENKEYSLCGHNAIILKPGIKMEVDLFNHFGDNADINIQQAINMWLIPTASIVVRKEIALYNPCWCANIYSSDYKLLLLSLFKGKIKYFDNIMSIYRFDLDGKTITAHNKNNPIFVMSQHLLLLESFNKGTEYIYSPVIEERINFLKKEIVFSKLKNKSLLLAFFLKPNTFLAKIIKRAKKYLCVNKYYAIKAFDNE